MRLCLSEKCRRDRIARRRFRHGRGPAARKGRDAACRGERTRSRSRVCRIGGRFGRGERPRPVGTDYADDRESQSGHYDGGDARRGRADREHAFVHGHYRQCRRVPLPLFQEDRRFRSARQIRHLRHGRQGGDLLSAGDFARKPRRRYHLCDRCGRRSCRQL